LAPPQLVAAALFFDLPPNGLRLLAASGIAPTITMELTDVPP
jgi:hypothetical protein